MNWKTEAEEKLTKLQAMRCAARNLPEEIRRLELMARSLRSAQADVTPVKGMANRREEALLNNLVHRQELQWSLEQAQIWLQTTEQGLTALTPEERLILERLYICPEEGAVTRLCDQFYLDRASIYRKRDQALRKFTLALYGTMES